MAFTKKSTTTGYTGYKFARRWTGTRAVTSYKYYSQGKVYKSSWKVR